MPDDRLWKQISPTSASRPLIGAEKMLNYAEYYQNGNFQLTISMVFETNVAPEVLRRRFGLALWIVRGYLPELGMWSVATAHQGSVNLDHITFQAIQTIEEAQNWIQDTAICVKDGTTSQQLVDFLSNHRIEPAGKQFRAYLVANPSHGNPSLVLNASHVANGHRLIFQGCAIVQALVDGRLAALTETVDDDRQALEAIFAPEDVSRLIWNLPQSLNTAYIDKFNPGTSEMEIGMEKLGERISNGVQPTIGIPRFSEPAKNPTYTLGTVNGQPLTMLNLRRNIGATEHQMLHRAYKKRGSSLPSFVYACLVNSIDRRCKASTSEQGETPGANLVYSAHASRWFPLDTFTARSPVNMAIALGSGYVAPDELRSGQRGRDLNEDELFALAKTIRVKQEQYLESPHIISAMEQVGDDVSFLVADNAVKQQQQGTDGYVALCENAPAICPPTMTSQNAIRINRLYTAAGASDEPKPKKPEGEYLYFVEGMVGGRTTDATVCFALWSFAGILTLQTHFDSRFFDAKLIDTILDDVVLQLRCSAANGVDVDREAKL